MIQPEWKDAPDWAQWVAFDGVFGWVWYEHKPNLEQMPFEPLMWDVPGNEPTRKQRVFKGDPVRDEMASTLQSRQPHIPQPAPERQPNPIVQPKPVRKS